MAGPDPSEPLKTFLNQFTTFVRVDFSCKQIDEEDPHELVRALWQDTQSLSATIASETGGDLEVHLWPTLLTTCEADAVISRQAGQDRGTYLLGLRGQADRNSVVAILQSWQIDVRTSTLFSDYVPSPSLSSRFILRDDISCLVVDYWMCPERLDGGIMIFSTTHVAQEDSGITNAGSGKSVLTRAGSSVAEATARCSPFPSSKKLTPADAILNRLKWDDAFDSDDYIVVYEDRHTGLMDSAVDAWTTESTEETFVPMHRIRAVTRKSTAKVVWHREERIDLISGRTGVH